jgi:hypothetical protein
MSESGRIRHSSIPLPEIGLFLSFIRKLRKDYPENPVNPVYSGFSLQALPGRASEDKAHSTGGDRVSE